MEGKSGWMKKDIFLQICDSIMTDEFKNIEWENHIKTLSAEKIYKIAVLTPENTDLFIGVKGGTYNLVEMSNETIRGKSWGISTKKVSSNWIDKKEFIDIMDEKEVFKSPTSP
jgi:hypothetical protein